MASIARSHLPVSNRMDSGMRLEVSDMWRMTLNVTSVAARPRAMWTKGTISCRLAFITVKLRVRLVLPVSQHIAANMALSHDDLRRM